MRDAERSSNRCAGAESARLEPHAWTGHHPSAGLDTLHHRPCYRLPPAAGRVLQAQPPMASSQAEPVQSRSGLEGSAPCHNDRVAETTRTWFDNLTSLHKDKGMTMERPAHTSGAVQACGGIETLVKTVHGPPQDENCCGQVLEYPTYAQVRHE